MSNFSTFSGYAGPVTAYGSSYMADPAISTDAQGHEMYRQVAQRGGIANVASYGVSGSRLIEIAARMVGPVPTAGDNSYPAADVAGRIVLVDGATNDAQFTQGSGATPTPEESAAAQEAVRTICAVAGTRERIDDTDPRWTYAGSGWGAATAQTYASGGTYKYNVGDGSSCSCTWTQPANVDHVYFLGLGSPAAGSAGGYTAAVLSFSVDGGAATTKNFAGTTNSFSSEAVGNTGNNFSVAPVVCKVAVPVSSLPTQHTLMVAKVGTNSIITVDALLVPAANPTRVTLLKSPPLPTTYGGAALINAMLPTFNGYVAQVAQEFAYAHVVDWQGAVNGAFNDATMIGPDNIHPNLAGETHVTDQAVADINAGLPGAPVITSATTATATAGTAFAYQITATNNPTGFGATGLPTGASVNNAGLISFPASLAAGTYTLAISATNAGGTGTATLTLTVNAAPVVTPPGSPVYPPPNTVAAGEQYGPTGTEYTGTLQVNSTGGGLTSDQAAAIALLPGMNTKLANANQILLAVPFVPGNAPALVIPPPPDDPTLRTVYGYLQTPQGEPASNLSVTFLLKTPAAIRGNRLVAGRRVTVSTDSRGFLSAPLERPDKLTPAGSVWLLLSADLGLPPQGLAFTPDADTFDLAGMVGT